MVLCFDCLSSPFLFITPRISFIKDRAGKNTLDFCMWSIFQFCGCQTLQENIFPYKVSLPRPFVAEALFCIRTSALTAFVCFMELATFFHCSVSLCGSYSLACRHASGLWSVIHHHPQLIIQGLHHHRFDRLQLKDGQQLLRITLEIPSITANSIFLHE